MLSAICEQFNCLPSQALGEDPALLHRIVEYRAALEISRGWDDISKLTKAQADLGQEMYRAKES